MRTLVVGLLFGVAGFGAGVAVARWTAPETASTPSRAPVVSPPQHRVSPPLRVGPPPRRIGLAATPAAENAALRDELELVRGLLVAHTGERLSWPADLVPSLTPEAMNERLEPIAEAIEAAFVELDCAEYPCVLLVESADDEPYGEVFRRFYAGDLAETTYQLRSTPGVDSDGRAVTRHAVTFLTEDDTRDPTVQRRLQYRMKTLVESTGSGQ